MRRRDAQLAGVGLVLLGLSGCAAALVGAGAAGGYALSKDSIRNTIALPRTQVYRAARDTVRDLGLIMVDDEGRGSLKATVRGASVTVSVKQVTERAVELKVSARNKLLMPKMEVAQQVYNRILEELQPL